MPKSDQARAAELLTVPDFVKAAQDGDRRADAMVAKALEWTQVRIRATPTPIWIGRRPGQSACDVLIDAYATGTDGRRLAEVLDALGATFHVVATDHEHKAMAMALAAVRRCIEQHRCSLFIAACAALLVARGELEEK